MNYLVVSKNKNQFLAATSLHVEEFEYLLKYFAPICEKYFRYNTLEGVKRKIISSKEHGNAKLQGTEQKLFFLLVYLKTNNLQELQAANFGISQTKVSRISNVLLELLNETLKKMGLMPIRDGELLSERLANHPTKIFSYDGLERGILKNTQSDAQDYEYSQKKNDTV